MPPSDVVTVATASLAPRVVAAGRGAAWWAEGWRGFRAQWGTWAGMLVAYAAISLVLGAVPSLGKVAEWLLSPVLLGGIMLGCAAQRRGERLRIAHLFDGFRSPHFVPLLMISVWNFVLCAVAVVAGVVVLGIGIGTSGLLDIGNLASDPMRMWRALGFTYLALLVIALLLFTAIAMANWFAPALVVMRGTPARAAMAASLRTCLRNWAPFLVYSLVGAAIALVVGGTMVAAAGAVGYESVVAVLDGDGSWTDLSTGAKGLGVAFVLLVAAIAAVAFGSTYAGYRDTLAPDAIAEDPAS